MIKYFCDKCGKEIESGNLCSTCQKEDLTCGFKVGDVVTTDDGRIGFIESFCTCDKCKSRGFYEPKVATTTGVIPIYISNTDKSDGFVSFYRIGDRIFGNIERSAVSKIDELISTSRQTIKALEANIKQYEKQLGMVRLLEAKQEEQRKEEDR